MDQSTEAYNPTMLTGLGLFLTLCMPAIMMIALIAEDLLPFGMGTVIIAPIVAMFVTPVGILVLSATFVMQRKRNDKQIEWRSALSGCCIAIVFAAIAWFMKFSFGN